MSTYLIGVRGVVRAGGCADTRIKEQDQLVVLVPSKSSLGVRRRHGEQKSATDFLGPARWAEEEFVAMEVKSGSCGNQVVDLFIDQDEVVALGQTSANLIKRLLIGGRNLISNHAQCTGIVATVSGGEIWKHFAGHPISIGKIAGGEAKHFLPKINLHSFVLAPQ